jgi:Flp pilus assembly protein TadG
MNIRPDFLRRRIREADGAAMVEFAIALSVLLMLVLGVLEFGLIWYAKQAATNATREGARYGVIYQTDANSNRIPPSQLSPSIESVVNNYLARVLPPGTWQVSVTNNTAYQTGQSGADLIVTVTCTNPWDLLGGFIPPLKNLTFSAQTVMKCE